MRTIVMLIAVMLVSTVGFARKIKGTIVANGQEQQVTFNVKIPFLGGEPSFERMQYRIKYFDEAGKKHLLRPDDAAEIRFEFEGQPVRMISCRNNLGLGNMFSTSLNIFLKLEIDGPLRLYRYYYRQTSGGIYTAGGGYTPGTSYTVENFVFQKGDGPLKRSDGWGWRKEMLKYFSDCPALASLIESKELRKREVEAIVMFYNDKCAN